MKLLNYCLFLPQIIYKLTTMLAEGLRKITPDLLQPNHAFAV